MESLGMKTAWVLLISKTPRKETFRQGARNYLRYLSIYLPRDISIVSISSVKDFVLQISSQ